jgi:aspartyl-tRNA(Asn)/glutamyl-tRNA(Gln) amidotransferase subunit A
VRYGRREQPKRGSLADMYAATRAAVSAPRSERRIMIGTTAVGRLLRRLFNRPQKVRALSPATSSRCGRVRPALTRLLRRARSRSCEKSDDSDRHVSGTTSSRSLSSLAGLPGHERPRRLNDQGLPLGLQLIGRPLDEQSVLNAGLALEERSGFTHRAEAWW